MLSADVHVTKLLEHYKIPYLFRSSQAHALQLWERAISETSTQEFSSLYSPYVELFFSELKDEDTVSKTKFQQKDPLLDGWVTGVQNLWLTLAELYEVQNVQQVLDYLNHNQGHIIRDAFIGLVLSEKFIAESSRYQFRKSLTVFVREMQVLSSMNFCLHESHLGLTLDRSLPKVTQDSPSNYILLIPLSLTRIISLSNQKIGRSISDDDELFESYSSSLGSIKTGEFSIT